MRTPKFFFRHAGAGSLLASLTNALAIFLIFRLGYRELGPPAVGMWALIQGIMFISRVADGGSGGNITRLVAIDRVKQGGVRLRNFILTGLLVGTGPILILGGLMLAPTFYYLNAHYGRGFAPAAIFELLLCSVAFAVLTSGAQILAGCLDGLGLMALRGYLSGVANLLFVPIGYVLVRNLSVAGFGLAYVVYASLMALLFLVGIKLFTPPVNAHYQQHAVRELFRKTVSFNIGFLVLTLSRLLLDPTCKLVISWVGGLDAVAIFDLANKITMQARVLFQAGLRNVLPLLSREGSGIDPEIHAKLLRWNGVIARWALNTMSAIVLTSGYLSISFLGGIRDEFVLYMIFLSAANVLNTVGLIGYYTEVGSGHLRRLMAIFLLAALSNVSIGGLAGYLFGDTGVVIGFAVTLAWSGIAMARPVLGSPAQIARALLPVVIPELAVFCLAILGTWLVMVELTSASAMLRGSVTGGVGLLLTGVFAIREWERISANAGRLWIRLARVTALARGGASKTSN